MGIFSKSKREEELILVFNVGSSYVGGAFFLTQKSGIPKIIFSVKEPIKIEKEVNIDRLLFLTIQALNIVAEKAYNAHLGAPDKIFCALSSPWYVSQTRIINFKKNTPFLFTAKLADSLIKKEVNLLEEEYLFKNINATDSFRIIELKNIKIMLNGYETDIPLNKKAKELEMVIFVSMGGESVLKKIEETIGHYFHFKPIIFNSFVLASFFMIRNLHIQQEDFLLVDVGGEVTDISMTKSGSLCESITFPLGRNFLTREVSSQLHCSLNEADGIFSLLKDSHIEKSLGKKLIPIINGLKGEWLKKFQKSLEIISHDMSIPSTVYVVADSDIASFVSDIIEFEEFSQYSFTLSKFKVVFLNTKMLHGIVSFKEDVIRDPDLIVNSIYINDFLIKPITLGQI